MAQVVIALDSDARQAERVLRAGIAQGFTLYKIGHVLFDTFPQFMDTVVRAGGRVLLDLKFHDIPSVIGRAIASILSRYPLFGLTVHTAGGRAMAMHVMQAVAAAAKTSAPRPAVFGVTVLTSLDTADLRSIGFTQDAGSLVLRLAAVARDFGLDGVVCSPHEVRAVKETCGSDFLTLVPGVSLPGDSVGDQKRTALLGDVIAAGADFIVIGRSIYEATDIDERLRAVRAYLV